MEHGHLHIPYFTLHVHFTFHILYTFHAACDMLAVDLMRTPTVRTLLASVSHNADKLGQGALAKVLKSLRSRRFMQYVSQEADV